MLNKTLLIAIIKENYFKLENYANMNIFLYIRKIIIINIKLLNKLIQNNKESKIKAYVTINKLFFFKEFANFLFLKIKYN